VPSRWEAWIGALGLQVLEGESGWFGELARSQLHVPLGDGHSPVSSSIWYLLTPERPVNYLHHLTGDDTHVLVEGGPVDYWWFTDDGRAEHAVCGRDLSRGERPAVAVPGGSWKGLRLADGAEYALMVTVVTPAWTPASVTIGAGQDFLDRWRGATSWADEELLRALIGPNWRS
jgi:uncharacterized protein